MNFYIKKSNHTKRINYKVKRDILKKNGLIFVIYYKNFV